MEKVFVVPRADFFGGVWPQGFVPMAESDGAALLTRLAGRGYFLARDRAEEDPSHKQLIPYCIVAAGHTVLCVHRKTAQSEARLHGLWSLGLGGHVNPEDAPAVDTVTSEMFLAALRRELDEELEVPDLPSLLPRFLGLLNDEGNAVGRVHAGLVYLLDTRPGMPRVQGGEKVRIREISKMTGGFRSLADLAMLWQDRPRFETWSRILLEADLAGLMGLRDGSPGSLPRPRHQK